MIDATPLIRLYAAYRRRVLTTQDPVAAQQRTLLKLVSAAKNTRFAKDHGFSEIRSVGDFQRQVPLRRYEDLWKDYWEPVFPHVTGVTWHKPIHYFAQTSGTTTGKTKYIPCSHDILMSNRMAMFDLLTHHLTARPQSHIFGGLNFMLGGSTKLVELAPGLWSGDLSGIAGKTMPSLARLRYFPPRGLETIADWEEKIEKMARASIDVDIRAIGGTPPWLLLFFDRLAQLRPESRSNLAAVYPNLEMLVHGGVSFQPYRSIFAERLAGTGAETREVYPASEGFIALADRGDGEGLRLQVDRGLFFEFVPLEELDSDQPTRHWLMTAERDVNYAIVLSTCAGLWSYIVGDTIRFVDLHPPRIKITGRTSFMLSAFGEHLIVEEIDTAVTEAANTIHADATDYAVGAIFPQAGGDVGGHLYIVEFAGERPDDGALEVFAARIDACLSAANEDYAAHRAGDFGMKRPAILAARKGTFAGWMKRRGRLGGQNKVPRIITSQDLFADLRSFVEAESGVA